MWQQVEQSLHSSMGLVVNKIATLLPGNPRLYRRLPVLSPHRMAGPRCWYAASSPPCISTERMRGGASAIAEWSARATPRCWSPGCLLCFVFSGRGLAFPPCVIGATSSLAGCWATFPPGRRGHPAAGRNVLARFVARSVLITGVNLNLSYARLLSMGVRWMILVLTGRHGPRSPRARRSPSSSWDSAFFRGIVFALALAVGSAPAIWSAARWNAKPRARWKLPSRRRSPLLISVQHQAGLRLFSHPARISLSATAYASASRRRWCASQFPPGWRFTTLESSSPHSTSTMLAGPISSHPREIELALVLDAVKVQVIQHHRFLLPVHRARAFVFVDQP